MILRRLTTSLKRQDWTALTLEFVLIVVGILLALSVDQWQSNQTNIKQEKIYVSRLLEEASSIKSKTESYLQLHTQIRDNALQLLERIENVEYCIDQAEEATERLLTFGDFPPPNFAFTSVNELIASGKMPLIRSDDLRLKSAQMVNYKDFLFLQWERYMVTKRTTDRALYIQMGFTMSSNANRGVGEERKLLTGFSFKTLHNLCGNRETIADMGNVTYTQLVYVRYIERFLAEVNGYLADLQQYSTKIKTQ